MSKELSHEEVWDDSALIESWNEALAEYKKYHSLAVKGEGVTLSLDEPVKEEAATGEKKPVETNKPDLVQKLMPTVSDDDMKNVMMSWYYAGYYTGLMEGQQKAYAAMQNG
ncbi:hypothetical protein K470DRAFT_267523 [Piedraia hortae CBS 480.64]|uniref:Survival Motor Neuron Gemin2-binding domain-containing protein n=1 Tax=Piedraia hortae CBS 480.64 TaxID=1314780 RepID=A0A6A7C9U0_9PEZI|nr:hypothetical protein K470DRAFT_267523 [Piedraia hortae CBS 480.64]